MTTLSVKKKLVFRILYNVFVIWILIVWCTSVIWYYLVAKSKSDDIRNWGQSEYGLLFVTVVSIFVYLIYLLHICKCCNYHKHSRLSVKQYEYNHNNTKKEESVQSLLDNEPGMPRSQAHALVVNQMNPKSSSQAKRPIMFPIKQNHDSVKQNRMGNDMQNERLNYGYDTEVFYDEDFNSNGELETTASEQEYFENDSFESKCFRCCHCYFHSIFYTMFGDWLIPQTWCQAPFWWSIIILFRISVMMLSLMWFVTLLMSLSSRDTTYLGPS